MQHSQHDHIRGDLKIDVSLIPHDAAQGNCNASPSSVPHGTAMERGNLGNGLIAAIAGALLATGLTVGMFSSMMTALAQQSAHDAMTSIGAMDVLGKRVYELKPVMDDPDALLPYDKEAVAKKRRNEILAANMNNQPVVAEGKHDGGEPSPENETESASSAASSGGFAEQVSSDESVIIPGAETGSMAYEPQTPSMTEAEIQRRDQELIDALAGDKLGTSQQPSFEWLISHPQKNAFKSVIAISGEIIPMVNDRKNCPSSAAGVWRGDNSVTDGKGMYVLGHNPGVFHNLIDRNYRVGSTFTVWDENGDARIYTVTDVFVIPVGTQFDAAHQARTINSGGECVVLQTCIDNSTRYKVFVAH